MELIVVNSQKLKIILDKDDMLSFDISGEDLDYSSAKTRKALGNILERAKAETGFDTGNDRLYIQVFLSVDGGCEMFFTKRARLLPEPESKSCSLLKKKYATASDYSCEYGRYIAKSDNIDNIIDLCIRLKKEGFYGASSLYELKGGYILTLDFRHRFSFASEECGLPDFSRFSFICAYAEISYADPIPSAYIEEHGKAIIKETAVETICESFGD